MQVDANPGGTTFILKPGLFRMQWITPKDGDVFIGEPGAILNGSKVLSSFVQEGPYWVALNQTQQEQVHYGAECLTGYACQSPEDLFFDDKPLTKVDSLVHVAPGKWFFDYANDKIYFLDDPTGIKVETSVTKHAFEGIANNVTIRGLIIEKYANPCQFGAINTRSGNIGPISHNWLIENNEIRLTHGDGIHFYENHVVRKNFCHDNGTFGIAGSEGKNAVVDSNEISSNGWYAGVSWGWGAGGTKFAATDSLTISNNVVHDNGGPGLWTDINNINVLYEGNLSYDNLSMGIFHEIGYKAIIRNNTCKRNAKTKPTGWLYDAQIFISSSRDVDVSCNYVEVDAAGGNGITMVQQNRQEYATNGPHITINNSVHNNEIVYLGNSGVTGIAGDYDVAGLLNGNNQFQNNTYHVLDTNQSLWSWCAPPITFSQFQSFQQELSGTVDTKAPFGPGNLPGCAAPVVVSTSALSNASEAGAVAGLFEVTRTGSISNSLVVNFALSGSASASDYQLLTGTVTIPAGSASAIVSLTPVDDNQIETTETVILKIVTGSSYSIDSLKNSAVITIADNDAKTVCNLNSAIVIDGISDPVWSTVSSDSLLINLVGTVPITADLSGTFKTMWDANYLYLFAEITDDSKVNDSALPYDDDALEIFIDGNNDKTTSYDSDDHQYIFRWNDNNVHELHNGTTLADNPLGITFAQANTTNGYTMEIQLAWSAIGVSPSTGKNSGLDIHVNDDDDGNGRDNKKTWMSLTDDAYNNPSSFGTVQLSLLDCSSLTGINKNDPTAHFEINPNPSTGEFIIKVDVATPEVFTIKITDVLGRLIFDTRFMGSAAPAYYAVDLKDWGKGMYTVQVAGNRLNETKKIIIE